MRFPLSWLKTWVDLPADIAEVSQLLMKAGVGLEAVEDAGAALDQVVVAQILERQPHPNADKLSMCRVNDGQRDYAVVCGAPNAAPGLKVPFAKEGASLPGGLKIKRSKIRGVESEGMLCAAEELGLPASPGGGLLTLEADAQLGRPLAAHLGLDDPVLVVETTANRPDHLSLRGLAREISALGRGLVFRGGSFSLPAEQGQSGFRVAAEPEACSYYSLRLLSGVKVGPSPEWLRKRLERSGLRSINNVVDATNCVLLEYGQPLHAFDAARLSGGILEARLARPGERLQTLDGQERVLTTEDAVIADARGPQALAGLMGGAHSEVRPETTELALEAAVFHPRRLRRSSRRLGLASESSVRFERGVDPMSVDEALDRCAALILELAGGSLTGGRLSAGSKGELPAALPLDAVRIAALLGLELDADAMAALLERRGFGLRRDGAGWTVQPPSWRRDVKAPVDLAEEVLQLAGLESLPSTRLPEVLTPDPDDAWWENCALLRERLRGLGLMEAGTLSYLDPRLAEAWGLQAAPVLDNPLSSEQSLLRPSLLPNLVEAALGALRRRQSGLAAFELGRCFSATPKGLKETERVAVLLAGEAELAQWNAAGRAYDYYDLRGIAETLGRSLDLAFRSAAPAPDEIPAWAHPGQCAKISLGGLQGYLAGLHPALLARLDAPRGLAAAFALELEYLNPGKPLAKEPRYAPFPRVPAVERDLSCLVDSSFEAGRVLDFLRTEGGLGQARVLDRFEGSPLPAGRKSLTFRLTYSAEERSLTDAEVNQRHAELLQRLETALPLEVRR